VVLFAIIGGAVAMVLMIGACGGLLIYRGNRAGGGASGGSGGSVAAGRSDDHEYAVVDTKPPLPVMGPSPETPPPRERKKRSSSQATVPSHLPERPPVARPAPAAVSNPEPPAEWAVPKAGAVPNAPPAGTTLPTWPAAFANAEAAMIDAPPGGTVKWSRVDLQTGKTIGEPMTLWQESGRLKESATAPGFLPAAAAPVFVVAALTADGKSLALRDPADATRVDVWDVAGKRVIGLNPYGDAVIDWLGWSAGGRLLILGDGRLTGWDVAVGKNLFDVDGDYVFTGLLAPGRAWLAVASYFGHVDVLDAESGRCLGRCTSMAGMPWHMATMSPDGKTLLCTRALPVPPARRQKAPTEGKEVLHSWDLTTGQARPVFDCPAGVALQIYWAGPNRFLTAMPDHFLLFDFDSRVALCRYEVPSGQSRALAADPSGHAWTATKSNARSWQRLEAPNPKGDDAALDTGELVFPRGALIRVEVRLGNAEKSGKLAERLAGNLQLRGLTIGRGGWTLRVDHSFSDTSRKFKGEPVVQMEVKFHLIAPEGAEVSTSTQTYSWEPERGDEVGVYTPRILQKDDLLKKIPGTIIRAEVPDGVLKTPSGYLPLPLKAKLDLEAP
jgi:hypothetical protein